MPFIVGIQRTSDEALEERLVAQVGIVLLEMLFGRGNELDGGKLVTGSTSTYFAIVNLRPKCIPSPLKAADNFADEATLSLMVNY